MDTYDPSFGCIVRHCLREKNKVKMKSTKATTTKCLQGKTLYKKKTKQNGNKNLELNSRFIREATKLKVYTICLRQWSPLR